MRKLYVLLFALFAGLVTNAQLSGTKNIPGDYADLAAAIADLNTQGVAAGGVTLNLVAGNAQTAPAGGYVIGGTGAAILTTTSSSNPVIIQGNGNTITASNALTSGALNDAIFKLIGADWVTITGFTMLENAANTTTTAASNNMTEWGVALLYVAATDGAQNNTIQGNVITLNRTYQNSFGIYSNSTHTATAVTTSVTATTAAGGNSGLKLYSNNISNVNNGICIVGPTPAADANIGIEVGGTVGTANTITNYGTTGTFSAYANVSGTVNGILIRNSNGFIVSYNTVTSSVGGVTAGTLNGIQVQGASNTPSGTFTNNVNNNNISLQSGAASGGMNGINYPSGSASATSVVNINNNDFNNFGHTVTASGTISFITLASTNLTTTISNNTFTNITVNTTGSVTFISHSLSMPVGGTNTVSNNSIVTAFNKTGSGGTVTFTTSGASSPNGSTSSTINNNFSNVTVAGSTTIQGTLNNDGSSSSPTKIFTGNTYSNLTAGTGSITGVTYNYVGATTSNISNNTFSNITGQGAITAMVIGSTFNGATTLNVASNTINNLVSTGTGGSVQGITCANTSATININNNAINTLSTTAGSAVNGIVVSGATTTNVFKNKIYDLSGTNAGTTVNGVLLSGGTTLNVYNNLVGDLRATAASGTDVIRGISSTSSSSSSTINISFNTVYLNATSSGTNFGTSGLFHTTSATATTAALSLRNNVIVNTSTPAGTGLTVAYRRSNATLTNYASASNNNLFYAGTPGAANLIFYDGTNADQTLAAYKARVSPRDANSVTENPPFISTTGSNPNFLHINTSAATQIESGGIPVTGITDDYDAETRNATTPDIGADEGNFTLAADQTPPTITYTPLTGTCTTGDRTLTVTIVDAGGIPTVGGLVPRIYFKKNNDTYVSAAGTLASGNANNGTWDFVISASALGGLTNADVVSYYVIAQDNAANISSNPSGATATDVNTVTVHPSSPNFFAIGIASGTFTVGSGGNFTTLTQAVAAYNAGCIAGPIVFNLTDATYSSAEIFPIVINNVPAASSTNTLTIQPATGVNATITGTTGGNLAGLIRLNGAQFVTIDGRNTGGSSLTIENTSTTAGAAVIWLSSNGTGAGAHDNAIKNTSVKGGVSQNTAATSTYGIVSAGSALNATFTSITGGDDNDNNLFEGNTITKVRYALHSRGGSTTNANTGTIIRNNIIGPSSFGADEIGKGGIVVREEDGVQITGNEVRFIGGNFANTSAGADRVGISLGTDASWTVTSAFIKNAVVTNNKVHDIIEERTFSAVGIAIGGADGSNATNNLVANNMLYNIKANGTSGDQAVGIGLSAGNGDRIAFNTVYMTGDTDPDAGATTPTTSNFGLSISSTSVTNPVIKSNILYMDITSSSASTLKNASINIPSSYTWGTGASDYNDLYINTTNAQSNIGCVGGSGGTFHLTIGAWRTAVTQDANSINIEPIFVSATDLHLALGSNPLIDGKGTPVTGVTTDIDNEARDASVPDPGADEFAPAIVTDAGISAIVLPATVCPGSTLVSATVKNLGSTTITSVTINWSVTPGGAQTPVNPTVNLAPGETQAVPLGNFTFVAGTTYSITASTSNPNGGADFNTANDAFTQNNISTGLLGDYTVGVGGSYTTLTAALAAYNSKNLCGPVSFILTDATYPSETFPLVINANASANATNTLTIKPATGITPSITGSSSSCLLNINGGDYVIIDGSNNATASRDLTFTNTNTGTSSAVVCITSLGTGLGATNNVIRNTNMVGSTLTATNGTLMGIFSGGTSISITGTGTDNDNNTIQNNNITKVSYGIYSSGASAANPNTGTIISQNVMNAPSPNNLNLGGIYVRFENGVEITQNNISVLRHDGTAGQTNTAFGIALGVIPNNTVTTFTGSDVTGAIVTRNKINGVVQLSSTGYSAFGIVINTVTSGTTLVANNMISGVQAASTASDFTAGIVAGGGTGSTTNVYYNTVSMTGARGAAKFPSYGLAINSGDPIIDVRNNIFENIQTSSDVAKMYAIATGGAAFTNLTSNYNDFYVSGASSYIGQTGGLGTAGTDRTALADWQATTGKDANSVTIQPVYVSATDLHLAAGSNGSLDNLGTPVTGVTIDIDNQTRSASTPDIGADEFSNSGSLPVSIVTFSGQRLGNSNNLKWTIVQEIDVQAYDVERSYNGRSWERIGSVASLGNTSSQRTYAFSDNSFTGLKQQYRLRVIDRNTAQKLSNIVIITGTKPVTLTLSGLFPNPALTKVNVLVDAPAKDNVTIVVMDVAGRIVKMQKNSIEAGSNTLQLNVGDLAQGSYMLKLTCESSNETSITRFIKE